MNKGVLFRWEDASKVVAATENIYRLEIPIIYIPNRVNNYYVVPSNWLKFYQNRHKTAY
jgi:hypothetical protein